MSTQTASKKRKSTDGSMNASKKVKMAKSAEKPAPLKSALKRPSLETSEKVVLSKPSNAGKAVKKAAKGKDLNIETTEAPEEVLVEDNETSPTDLTPSQTAALLAGFSSSDSEAEDPSDSEPGIPISTLPLAPTTKDTIRTRISTQQSDPDTTPGVIYIGRIPHGFYEPQMKAYFSQFGSITNLRLARNKKTGASQHYAFIEFASSAVADIVARTMDKYLLFRHILQVRRVPKEQVKEGLFGKGRWKKPAPRNRFEGRKLKQGASREVWEKRVEMEKRRREEKAEMLRELGYEFDMPAVRGVDDVPIRQSLMDEVTAGVEADDGVKLLEHGNLESNVVDEAAQSGQVAPQEEVVVKETTTKKRAASGKTQTKKTVKKVKA